MSVSHTHSQSSVSERTDCDMLEGRDLLTLGHRDNPLSSVFIWSEHRPALKLFRFEELRLLLVEVDFLDGDCFWAGNILQCLMGTRTKPSSSSVTSFGIQNSLCQDKGNLCLSFKDDKRIFLGLECSLSSLSSLSK